MARQIDLSQIRRHEGMSTFPYRDTVGKLTIGVGRNLDDVGITREEAEFLLMNDVANVEKRLKNSIPWIEQLDPDRQGVLINMGFNLGVQGLMKFKRTLAAIKSGDYQNASKYMLQSKWAGQVGERAQELSEQMRTGITKV